MKSVSLKSGPAKEAHPVLVSAATMAHGLMRSMAIKPYAPRDRRREFSQMKKIHSMHSVRCQLFREKGGGSLPTIVVAGFVPDATETIEFQRPLLRRYGSIYYFNYPRNGFSAEMFSAQLSDLIDDIHTGGTKPLIMSVSFGSGLLVDFLRQADEQIHEKIRGLLLISPVICTDDLIRPKGEKRDGIRFLESSLQKIITADPAKRDELEKQVERSRRCFQALFAAGAENRVLSSKHLAIRRKIMDVLAHTSALGGYERVKALRELQFPEFDGSVFAGPVLTLLAENEGDILVPLSPTLELFADSSRYTKLFPNCRVKKVISKNEEDSVPHASMIFHHDAYNPLLESWYSRLSAPLLQMAV
ncbi:alpha/beta hydrolase [Oryzomonas sagensis]|uniref:Alpha/beta hydrolase n=1 Tax=Oryzomonas sagensis TaxID=2603857 RepID=A0ABQ6TQZ8_9BACT|nr:alpha/beta hydrolase [Oryzomonas sagensis]KAB0671184.1 alpha/beta hydrolase [Oryzomonas sagensis]